MEVPSVRTDTGQAGSNLESGCFHIPHGKGWFGRSRDHGSGADCRTDRPVLTSHGALVAANILNSPFGVAMSVYVSPRDKAGPSTPASPLRPRHAFSKTTIRLVFVPFALLSTPQQFAVFVNF